MTFFFQLFCFRFTEATWRTSLAHSSPSARKPHPSFCRGGRGYDSHRHVHYTDSHAQCPFPPPKHTHPSPPTVLSTFYFPPSSCQNLPTTSNIWYVVGCSLRWFKLKWLPSFFFSYLKFSAEEVWPNALHMSGCLSSVKVYGLALPGNSRDLNFSRFSHLFLSCLIYLHGFFV